MDATDGGLTGLGKVDSPFAVDGDGGGLEELIAALEASDADPLEFAAELGEGSEWAPTELVPGSLQDEMLDLHDEIGEGGLVKADEADGAPPRGTAAVVMIANGSERLWQRNFLEWVALSYFNLHMASHYSELHVCTGDEGRWDCVEDALAAVSRDPDVNAVDLVVEVHGGPRRAIDNEKRSITPAHLLGSTNPQTLRYGMFMNCWAASPGGFPQTFVAAGGVAAYGAPELSNPVSDLVFQVYFGGRGLTFREAVDEANDNLVDAFDRAWHSHGDAFFSPKQGFGNGDGTL